MNIDYRFNNGRGAVLCRKCRIIIDQDIGPDDAEKKWEGRDICIDCKQSDCEMLYLNGCCDECAENSDLTSAESNPCKLSNCSDKHQGEVIQPNIEVAK